MSNVNFLSWITTSRAIASLLGVGQPATHLMLDESGNFIRTKGSSELLQISAKRCGFVLVRQPTEYAQAHFAVG